VGQERLTNDRFTRQGSEIEEGRQRATPEEHAEASRKLEMRAKLNKGAY
jgi:hypothetical protein